MNRQPEVALALVRAGVGVVFAWHGADKIFGTGLEAVTAQFGGWGVPLPLLTAPLVAVLELAGGVLIVLGLGARPIAAALGAQMLAAIWFVHREGGFFAPRGVELPLLLLVGCAAVALGGPGWLSLGGRRPSPPPRAQAKHPARKGKA
ncbi:DoxX family protein [Deinococcus planocerae]|uniref:DoxX family protein n=1 Tax=Deinococcus planocerae TaxID=1737569 RepID=UPI000C7F0BC3|nr:DoxX family protein [Deinococcus planocerae]